MSQRTTGKQSSIPFKSIVFVRLFCGLFLYTSSDVRRFIMPQRLPRLMERLWQQFVWPMFGLSVFFLRRISWTLWNTLSFFFALFFDWIWLNLTAAHEMLWFDWWRWVKHKHFRWVFRISDFLFAWIFGSTCFTFGIFPLYLTNINEDCIKYIFDAFESMESIRIVSAFR